MTDPAIDPADPLLDNDEFAALRQTADPETGRGPNILERISDQLGELDPRLVVGVGIAALAIVTLVGIIALLGIMRGRPNPDSQPTVVVAVTVQPTLPPSPTLTPSLTPIVSDTPAGSPTVDLTATLTNLPDLRFATLSEIRGSVQIRTTADGPFRFVNETLTIVPGTTVLTGENSSAKVTLGDGAIVRLSSQTQFTITELGGSPGRPTTLVNLDFGKIWAMVGDIGEGFFQIQLPVGVASVRGTFLSAEYNATDNIVIITCLEGKCAYRNENGQVFMGTLQQTESIDGGPPSPPHRMDQNQIDDWAQHKIPEVVTLTATASHTPTRTPSRTATITPTPSLTLTPSATRTPTATGSASATTTLTRTNTNTATATFTFTSAATATPTRTNTPTNTPGPAHHLDFFTQPPTGVQAGAAFTVRVAIKDAAGNTVPYATNTITVDIFFDPGGDLATLSGTLSQAPVNGVATFSDLSINVTGVGYTLVASASPILPANTIVSNAFTVTPGVADHFSVSIPAGVTACTAFSGTITALDANNNIDVNYTGTVNFSSSDASPFVILPGPSTFSLGDAGVKTFSNFRLNTGGSQSINVIDGSRTGSGATTVSGNAPADHLHVTMDGAATVGTPEDVTVAAKDPCENIDPNYTGTIAFTSSDGSIAPGSGLPSNYTFVGLDAGIHVFAGGVTFVNTGSHTVTAADTTTTSINDTSDPVTVGP